jgi:hypothetical protein
LSPKADPSVPPGNQWFVDTISSGNVTIFEDAKIIEYEPAPESDITIPGLCSRSR